jgi:F-type H+-transporting ATPase subunit epsilon
MPDLLDLEVATPERELVHESVAEVQIPAKDGYMGVLPGHAPLLSEMGTGFLSYSAGGRKRHLSVQGGFVEVLADHVRILADSAERAEEIDVERAKSDLKRAQEQLVNPSVGVDPAVALEALAWAQARVDAAENKKNEL